jgi:hypothetical protein
MDQRKVKTIFDHVVDSSVINKTKTTPVSLPMIAHVFPQFIQRNIDIETDLKGINKPLTKCNKN